MYDFKARLDTAKQQHAIETVAANIMRLGESRGGDSNTVGRISFARLY